MKKIDKKKPDPDCVVCKGHGAYPPSEQNGLKNVIMHTGKYSYAIPCNDC